MGTPQPGCVRPARRRDRDEPGLLAAARIQRTAHQGLRTAGPDRPLRCHLHRHRRPISERDVRYVQRGRNINKVGLQYELYYYLLTAHIIITNELQVAFYIPLQDVCPAQWSYDEIGFLKR